MKPDVADPPDTQQVGRAAFFSVFPAIALPVFLAMVDQSIVVTALPEITANFRAADQIALVVSARCDCGTCARRPRGPHWAQAPFTHLPRPGVHRRHPCRSGTKLRMAHFRPRLSRVWRRRYDGTIAGFAGSIGATQATRAVSGLCRRTEAPISVNT